jgi:hypothetical protein
MLNNPNSVDMYEKTYPQGHFVTVSEDSNMNNHENTNEKSMEFDDGFIELSSQEEIGRNLGGEKFREISNILGRSGEGIEDTERIIERQLEVLEKHVKNTDYFDIEKVWNNYETANGKGIIRLEPGTEADVFLLSNNDEKKVIKIVKWNTFTFRKRNRTPLEFLINKIVIHNTLFPGTFYVLIGYCHRFDEFCFVLEQPYIPPLFNDLKSVTSSTEQEIEEDMIEKRGFRKEGKTIIRYTSDDYIVSDLHLGNVLKGADGELYYIDPSARLNENNRSYKNILKNF